jgi:sugar O-acyltransferase (sialic acid O-acetyltransferase NeuD family)
MKYMIGSGGHARVLSAFVDCNPTKDDAEIFALDLGFVTLVNGVGNNRRSVWEKFKAKGFSFETVMDARATIKSLPRAEGVQIMAGVVIQPGVTFGVNTLVNTGASIDHDCVIGAHVHVCPGAVLCGDVTVGDESVIGPGATVCRGVRIGDRVTVGAGAVVLDDVPDDAMVVGVPAGIKRMKFLEAA